MGGTPEDVAVAGGLVWVAVQDDRPAASAVRRPERGISPDDDLA